MVRRLTLILTLVAMVGLIAAPAVSAAPPARGDTLTGTTTQTVSGGVLQSTATITEVAVDAAGNLVASGTLTYTLGAVTGTTSFTDALLQTNGACDILTLDIGAIFLDLLGLEVDIAPISIDITAVPGAGNLLGNLLCAVAGLLDGPNPIGSLIDRLLGIINNLLG